MNIILICLAIKYNGDWDAIYDALERKEKVTIDETIKVEKMLQNSNSKIITILDNEYPNYLKNAYKPPFVIWVKGNYSLLNKKIACVAGNQKDCFSEKRINEFVNEIEKQYIILNPYFKGIDQEIVAKANNAIIHISASGNNFVNIQESNNLVLISEYPNETKASLDKFKNRNRLIAAFSENLILFTSKKNGKVNHLVSSFLNLGKEIYCFPGDGSNEDGNSELIKQGANLITSIKDISH